jgi:hypothetical protein
MPSCSLKDHNYGKALRSIIKGWAYLLIVKGKGCAQRKKDSLEVEPEESSSACICLRGLFL